MVKTQKILFSFIFGPFKKFQPRHKILSTFLNKIKEHFLSWISKENLAKTQKNNPECNNFLIKDTKFSFEMFPYRSQNFVRLNRRLLKCEKNFNFLELKKKKKVG